LFKSLANVFRIPELRNKLLFTLMLLCIYRIGFYIPIPGVRTEQIEAATSGQGPLGQLTSYLTMFSGGNLQQSTIFGLGIMPYISASIILQLLSTVLPSLEALRKEGEPGTRKINEWTRYITVGICLIQAGMWITRLVQPQSGLVYNIITQRGSSGALWQFCIMAVVVLTAGSMFMMWLGEQIDQYGIGNGVSLIITANIVARMPDAIIGLLRKSTISVNADSAHYGPHIVIFIAITFVFVVAGSILLTQAQRRIRIQQAKQMRGRKVFGGQAQYLPLRVNHSGVMPIIFASSLMIFPSMAFSWIQGKWPNGVTIFLAGQFHGGSYLYIVCYIGMIFFFSYFWNTVQFQPKELSNQLRDYGSFIPGLRPGKRTADYLEAVMNRITYVGAGFLCVIAIIPSLVATKLLGGSNEDYMIAQFLGGTGLLIVISVMLDFVNRIEANLLMRDYDGFMDSSADRAGQTSKKRTRPTGNKPGFRRTDDAGRKGSPA